MADAAKGNGLANLFIGLALGAPVVGMLIMAIGVFFPKDAELPWWATVIAFPMLLLGLAVIVPLTNADHDDKS